MHARVLTPFFVLALVTISSAARGESDFWEEMANPGILRYRELVSSGREAIDAGDYTQALESLEQARVLLPNDATAYSWIGYAQSRMGQHEEAVQACQRALQIDAPSVLDEERLAFQCATSHAQTGRNREAAELQGQMLARGVSLLYRAAVLVSMGDMLVASSCDGLDAAIELFQEAVRDYPDHAGAHWRLAAALIRSGADEEGRVELAASVRLDPQWQSLMQGGAPVLPAYDIHLFRALGWEQLGHDDQARSEWQAYLDAGGNESCWADLARNHLANLARRPQRRQR